MAKGIWIIIEHNQGKIRKVSLELLSQAKKMAAQSGEALTAVVLGENVQKLVSEISAYGADKIILAEEPRLAEYTTGAYTSVLNKMIRQEEPRAVLFGHTGMSRDLAPRLAQRLGVGVASDCIGMELAEKTFLQFKRPVYAGKAFAAVAAENCPVMATIRPNTFAVAEPDSSLQAEVAAYSVEIDPQDIWSVIKDVAVAVSKRPELTDANIIVSGGRGMQGPENFALLEALADTMGAAVGASRVAVDAGWLDHEFQVGQTGKTVSPTLYIACGISGAIQHLAGMNSSRYIVAINKDPEANIFNVADYGIVGDLFEIVPLLTQEIKAAVK
ncbi:MAG: electron transfer flavoprotein subunit alpha/FixB family protein [Veillonellales bacterium]